jgi:S-DNA-T family DNA segregation ATPase FtsK/SpoIIIE
VLGTPDAYQLPPTPGLGWLKVASTAYQLFKGALLSGRRLRPGTLPPAILPFGTAADRLAALAATPLGRTPVPRSGGTAASTAAGRLPARDCEDTPAPGASPALLSATDGRATVGTAAGSSPATAGIDAGDGAAGQDGNGPGSDMEAAVDALAAEGRRTGRAVHNVWLPPLPAAIAIDEVLAWPPNGRGGNGLAMPGGAGPVAPGEAGWLRVPVGVVDRPKGTS